MLQWHESNLQLYYILSKPVQTISWYGGFVVELLPLCGPRCSKVACQMQPTLGQRYQLPAQLQQQRSVSPASDMHIHRRTCSQVIAPAVVVRRRVDEEFKQLLSEYLAGGQALRPKCPGGWTMAEYLAD